MPEAMVRVPRGDFDAAMLEVPDVALRYLSLDTLSVRAADPARLAQGLALLRLAGCRPLPLRRCGRLPPFS
ncbi:hypothetical protein [Pseudoroseomonas sp. WGS1072]|uniref:hypothetical protein n=2 Tax=unclassified Roseomonas TaxID=2617492 RepID=UPI003BF0F1DD